MMLRRNRLKRAGLGEPLRCSFCHKSEDDVGKLISSPSDYPRAYICNECIVVCNSILRDDRLEQSYGIPDAGREGMKPGETTVHFSFDTADKDIRE
jgi:hypothetical protein